MRLSRILHEGIRAARATSGLLWAVGAALGPAGCAPSYPDAAHPDQPVPEEPPAFVFPTEAAIFVGHEGVSFLDARPRNLYARGHAAGAVQLDWLSFKKRGALGLTGELDADLRYLAGLLGDVGIARDDWVIVFGDPKAGWGEEGRLAWVLRYLGHDRVSVVDGGLPAWQAAGLPTDRGIQKRPRVEYVVSEVDGGVLADKAYVERIVKAEPTWDVVLVDTREPEEYLGTPEGPTYGAARRGHIPGAVNLPWRLLLDEEGRVLPPERLEPILIGRGVRPDARIVTYCTGGVRSAHTWWVLRSLGYPDVRNFSGSWWEWSLDRRLPARLGSGQPRPWSPPWPPGSERAGDDDDSAPAPAVRGELRSVEALRERLGDAGGE